MSATKRALCVGSSRWAASCTTMYSRHSSGFLASSVLRRIVARARVAASPSGFHPLHEETLDLHAHQRLPLRDQRRRGLLELLAIPFFQDGLLFRFIGAWAGLQEDLAVL